MARWVQTPQMMIRPHIMVPNMDPVALGKGVLERGGGGGGGDEGELV